MVALPTSLRPAARLGSVLALVGSLAGSSWAQAAAPEQTAAGEHVLVRITLDAPGEEQVLLTLGLDLDCGSAIVGEDGRQRELVVSAQELASLTAVGLEPVVVIPDLRAHYQARFAATASFEGAALPAVGASLTPPFGQGSLAGFYTWSEVGSVLDQLTAVHPAITTDKVSVGLTDQGRQVWMVKISDNPDVDEGEPEVRVDSMHHAREPMSMMSVIWFTAWLLEGYGNDPLATYLVDEREIYVLPVVNPDGYVHNQLTDPGGGGLWRKNRVDNGDGTVGVDLNRNYPFEWGFDNAGSSSSTSSVTYRGPSPASELETQHLLSLMASRDFATAISAHSSSNVWIRPWGYDTNAPLPGQAAYDEIGAAAAPPGWPVGTGVDTLGYPANGVTNDTDQGTHGTLSWTPEIGSNSDGFWPSTDRIVPLAEEVLPGLQGTVHAAGAWLRVLDLARDEEGDGDGFFEAGESVAFTLELRNSGLEDTATIVDLALTTTSPVATAVAAAVSLPPLSSFSSDDNASNPLRLTVSPSAPAGTSVAYTVRVTAEGYTQAFDGTIVVGEPRPFLFDDVEVDLGWTAGVPGDTASTGLWERADPVETDNGGDIAQPGDDNTSGAGTQAFVTGNGGGSAGSDDVDDGRTTLISPRFDLSGVGPASLGYARWFADLSVADDVFEVSISNDDGQSWASLESVAGNANTWVETDFIVSDVLAQTDAMRLRFVAQDDPNNSLVEALVDDLRVAVFDEGVRVNLYGRPALGADVRFNLSAAAGGNFTWYFSTGTADLQVGQIDGKLLLDPGFMFPLFSSTVPGSGLSAVDLTMPADPVFSGLVLYLQGFVSDGGDKSLSNRVRLELE